ncbi:hypothetical protein KL86DYS2_12951 [uncultured Dysgonomonas sp.]|uniref:Uncharacterized protein n=1 Tax=uncultured Dysgonomonas sp. TaxID=206096 RepID=A0A212K3U2_9BACT|nr:hypothetical protein KL86DYS2_12951 [uncultured Dysgonomonas sp.]
MISLYSKLKYTYEKKLLDYFSRILHGSVFNDSISPEVI